MGQLHELLPVREELKGARRKILDEAKVTFEKRTELFNGREKSYTPFDAALVDRESTSEKKALDTTVHAKLDYVLKHLIRHWDANIQLDATNQLAKADVVLDGVVFAKDVPSTFLLAMETELTELRAVLDTIPTLPPGRNYVPAPELGAHVHRLSEPLVTFKTVKDPQFVVVVPPTEHHPAVVKDLPDAGKNVGRWVEHQWFGSMSPAEKSDLIQRVDELSRAVKAARQRANSTPVVSVRIGKVLADYILDGKLPS